MSKVSLDIETGGKNPRESAIIQIAMYEFDCEDPAMYANYVASYGAKYRQDAFKVHGISKDFIKKNGVHPEKLAKDIRRLLERTDEIIGWNLKSLDIPFLTYFLDRYNLRIPPSIKITDVHELVKDDHYWESSKVKLSDAARHYGLKYKSHDAKGDAKVTYQIYKKVMK